SILRVGHGPVLLDNAETCAHVGLIGRFGADWFRGLGTTAHPGSTLVSVSGATAHPTVLEVSLGTPLRSILASAGADPSPRALLLGGYGGSWVDPALLDCPYDNESLARHGVSVGAGVIVVLARAGCGVAETHRVVRWMANESARQCGPCAFGLPALAEDLSRLVEPSRDARVAHQRLVERCGVIEGRGACRHPDGVVRLVRSAMTVFADDVADHAAGRPCAASRQNRHFATVPQLEREEELVWE
ncbi:MAG: NADH-ubiquinone oxidoreductase-F iron-sulfur binding region domain-containing protein, partial [Acidimicrobiales bacterium]